MQINALRTSYRTDPEPLGTADEGIEVVGCVGGVATGFIGFTGFASLGATSHGREVTNRFAVIDDALVQLLPPRMDPPGPPPA